MTCGTFFATASGPVGASLLLSATLLVLATRFMYGMKPVNVVPSKTQAGGTHHDTSGAYQRGNADDGTWYSETPARAVSESQVPVLVKRPSAGMLGKAANEDTASQTRQLHSDGIIIPGSLHSSAQPSPQHASHASTTTAVHLHLNNHQQKLTSRHSVEPRKSALPVANSAAASKCVSPRESSALHKSSLSTCVTASDSGHEQHHCDHGNADVCSAPREGGRKLMQHLRSMAVSLKTLVTSPYLILVSAMPCCAHAVHMLRKFRVVLCYSFTLKGLFTSVDVYERKIPYKQHDASNTILGWERFCICCDFPCRYALIFVCLRWCLAW